MNFAGFSCLFTVIISVGCVNSNIGDEACEAGWVCRSLHYCSSDVNDFETIFPCSPTGAPLRVCCPPRKATTTRTTTGTPSTTLGTTTTTPKTTNTTSKDSGNTTAPSASKKPITLKEDLPPSLQNKSSLLPDSCGDVTVKDRILNGKDADIDEYPWMALVGFEDNGEKKFFCGGTLISRRYILTAAHCSKAANYTASVVRLGEWNLTSEIDCQVHQDEFKDCSDPVVDVAIEKFIVHESYGNKSLPLLRYDIAIIRMERDVAFTDFIYPICLPIRSHRPTGSFIIVGWGVTDNLSREQSAILQFVNVDIFDFNECNSIAPAEVSPLLKKTQFCAGGSNGQDACKGDSGGPLLYQVESKIFQRGIVSLSTSNYCGTEGKPTVFTDVPNFVKWMLNHMEP